MKLRNTLIIAAVFLVMMALVWFDTQRTPEQRGTPAPTSQPEVLSLTTGNIKSIEIRDLRAPRQVTVLRTENGWQVQQPTAKAADSPTVDSAVGQLVALKASRVLTNVADIAPYGFITATLELRFVMSDTTPFALTVGNKTPDGSNYYAVYTGDRSKVFIVPSSAIENVKSWLETPPYEPTPLPTSTPTPPGTPGVPPNPAGSSTEGGTPGAGTPTVPAPNLVPTLGVPPAATPTP